MATLNFATGNSNVEGKVDYQITRTSTQYTISYEVFMRRKTSYVTKGNIKYTVYINNTNVDSKTKYYTITADKRWCSLCSGSKTYNLSALSTSTYSIGFESEDVSGADISAFDVKKTTTSGTVAAYATLAGKSTLSISFVQGENRFVLSGQIGADGNNNKSSGCDVYYTSDGSVPSKSNGVLISISGKANTKWSKTIDITKDEIIKAIAYTTAPYGGKEGEVATQQVYYYSPPYAPLNLAIVYNNKPTPKAEYSLNWDKPEDGYHNKVSKYHIDILINNNLSKQIETTNNSIKYLGSELSLKKGDTLQFTVYAIGESNYNNISPTSNSNIVTIISAGIIKIKIGGEWKEGQVWIKTEQGWKQATEVFIKNNNKWNSSI